MIGTSQCANEPTAFFDAMHTLRGKGKKYRMFAPMCFQQHEFMTDPVYRDTFDMDITFLMGATRRGREAGLFSFYPGDLHNGAPRWLSVHGCDVFIAAATPMDKHGYMKIPLCLIHEKAFLEAADRVILQINPNLPNIYGDTENVEDASHGLFDGLRTLDEKDVKLIVAPAFPEEGLGIAYMNRLKKAASQAEEVTIRANHRRLMFVCSGNTCRSPLAEAIFRSIFRSTGPHYLIDDPSTEGKVIVSSAGTFAKGDEPYTVYSVRAAKYEYDEDISNGYSKLAIKERLINQDLILTMTGDGSRYLRTRFPDLSDRIFSFQEILDDLAIPNVDGEVRDPYGYDYLVYMETAKQLDKIIRALLPEILKMWGMT